MGAHGHSSNVFTWKWKLGPVLPLPFAFKSHISQGLRGTSSEDSEVVYAVIQWGLSLMSITREAIPELEEIFDVGKEKLSGRSRLVRFFYQTPPRGVA